MTENCNVAARLSRTARLIPSALAIAEPEGRARPGQARSYRAITFAELDDQTERIACGLLRWGVEPGMRLVLAVPFGTDFIRLTFGLLKAGIVPVLVDPGMGRKNLVRCLEAAAPDGFVAIPTAHAIRMVLRSKFPHARWNVTFGRRWFWGGATVEQILQRGENPDPLPSRSSEDDAAVIFTTGSTGPPKGVRYTHGIFNHQIDLIRDRYQIRPGSRDLACFPLFGLFDAVMGVTSIIPDMDPTRPADVNPERILEAVEQWEIDQAFGSPALWNTVTRWCTRTGNRLPTLRRVLSAGAPVPPSVLSALRECIHPEANIYTPYGATESLPIASIESREVLDETAEVSREGGGTCVGTRFPSIEWKVIAIDDGPLATLDEVREVPRGEIGELMVTGPVVTRQYVTRTEQNALHKVRDGDRIWHRMGDVGYLDDRDRFWFCGRKAHRVQTAAGTLYTVPCEAIFNDHPAVHRSALVGIGPARNQQPVLIVEPLPEARPTTPEATERLLAALRELAARHPHTQSISDIRIHPSKLPVDIRHNSKIFREQLAEWAVEG
ncbi:fatty acid CoA ligase family protein [Candidatus Laterigemmans baculatus]|uniref:fatty acid CoA ligase family protein n=1 Tax=Candidatus Laterigemmans baculatus TaxID=2770505 RepID=UPI0013DC1F9F|nr:fatty acid CoA ligase family protein [Candidatus Laterigemmans baculatus]